MRIVTDFTFKTEPLFVPAPFPWPSISNPYGSSPNQIYTDDDGREWVAGVSGSPVPLKQTLVIAKAHKLFVMD